MDAEEDIPPSDYVRGLVRTAKAALPGSTGVTKTFLNAFFSDPRPNSSVGDRYFLVGRLERAVQSAFEGDGFDVYKSPKIIWKPRSPIKISKYLDLLIFNPQTEKAVIIEVKGRGFDGIASALSQFALARRFGVGFKAGGKQFDMKKNTKFVLLMGDANDRCEEIMKSLLRVNHVRVALHYLFLDRFVYESDTQGIRRCIRRFFHAVREHLT